MAYPSTEDLVAAASADSALASASPEDADTYRLLAIQAVESYTSQTFDLLEGTEAVDGQGSGEIYLPRRLLELTGVQQRGGDMLDLTNFEAVTSPNSSRLVWAQLDHSYYAQAMRAVQGWVDTRTFRSGLRTVLVTGSWGWPEPPREVIAAVRMDMEDQAGAEDQALAGTIHSYRRLGIRDISQGNLRLSLDPIAAQALAPRAAALVHHLVWTGPAGWRA